MPRAGRGMLFALVPIGVVLLVGIAVAAVVAAAGVELIGADTAPGDAFGRYVVIEGDTLLVGAPADDNRGSAYVFGRNGAGSWVEQQKLTASDGLTNDFFGDVVAIDGDTGVMGAFLRDDFGATSGAAYVFERDGVTGVFTETQKLLASDGKGAHFFAFRLAISGDTVLVGASGDDDVAPDAGAAYAFRRDPVTGDWVETQKLVASDSLAGDFFAGSVDVEDGRAVLGASFADDLGSQAGAAYVFELDAATGLWIEKQKLLATDGSAGDRFGRHVTINGDTLVVGAPEDDEKGAISGSAYLFRRDPTTGQWQERQKLTASDAAAGDFFGSVIAIQGITIVIGAQLDDDAGDASGSAYVFRFDPATGDFQQKLKLTAPDGAAGDRFGRTLSLSGLSLVVGAPNHDEAGSNAGAAYVFGLQELTGQSIADLAVAIDQLVADGALSKGQGTSLTSKLDAAVKSLENSNDIAAMNQVLAFLNQLQGFVNGGVLTAAQVEQLVQVAEAVVDAILGG